MQGSSRINTEVYLINKLHNRAYLQQTVLLLIILLLIIIISLQGSNTVNVQYLYRIPCFKAVILRSGLRDPLSCRV